LEGAARGVPEHPGAALLVHRQANVLTALPKSAHPGALAATRDIYHAEDIDKAQVAIRAFELDYGAKYPKAVAKITDDADVLLEFYKYQRSRGTKRRNCHGLQADRRRTGPISSP
jgi:putative transposase